ncbi:hypothetical protein CASFOL_016123 [Castilleja foliolosa]|uniref:KIB1-4 beta-propeller domain-containing protein n=1 Tax=Castilleja foliolosa TaxID=1961234 RepID=A0ABD3DJW6_9LAMI
MMDWADLSGDLLSFIHSKLVGEAAHNFGLVCRSWRAVATASPYRYSPCLMHYTKRNRLWNFSQFDSCIHMHLSYLENADIRCSNFGWLLMSRVNHTLFFFDPFNNQKIELLCKPSHGYTTFCFSHPPTSPDCVIVGFVTIYEGDKAIVKICVLTHGSDTWEERRYKHPKIKFRVSRGAPVFHRGLIYLSSVKGDVATFDIKKHGCKTAWVVNNKCLKDYRYNKEIKEHFLFKIRGEEEALFCVMLVNEERNVKLYRFSEPRMKWKLEKDIGDKVLHLSYYSSSGDTAHLKCMANRIYFPRFHVDSAVYYSFATGMYHSHNGHFSSTNSYDIKRLDFATWIMPASTTESSSRGILTWF